ncbi:MAG: hypothetical protein K0U84_15090 [Actinomycetia bacterium]|nr:hypothetical protein [Actinomycetes bacterium]
MAITTLQKLIKKEERRDRTAAIERVKDQAQTSALYGKGAAAGGTAFGAFADKRWGSEDEAFTWGDTNIPVNATAGPVLFLASMIPAFKKAPIARDVVGGTGFGMTMAALYRFTYDKVEPAEE